MTAMTSATTWINLSALNILPCLMIIRMRAPHAAVSAMTPGISQSKLDEIARWAQVAARPHPAVTVPQPSPLSAPPFSSSASLPPPQTDASPQPDQLDVRAGSLQHLQQSLEPPAWQHKPVRDMWQAAQNLQATDESQSLQFAHVSSVQQHSAAENAAASGMRDQQQGKPDEEHDSAAATAGQGSRHRVQVC